MICLASCQSSEANPSPGAGISTPVASPAVTVAASPQAPTVTPLPASTAPMPASLERLTFTVATNVGGMYPNTIIAFANQDGTGFETPGLFEPFRDTGGVTGKHLVWSPDGRYLAFDGADEIFDCGPNMGDCFNTNYGTFLADYSQGVIIQHIENTLTNSAWSPDSQKLVLSVDENQSGGEKSYAGDLFIRDVQSGGMTQLTDGPSSDLYPAWSPDGQWIAFIRYIPNANGCGPLPSTDLATDCDNGSLYAIRPDGSDLKLLSEPIHIEAPVDGRHTPYNAPSWSPDSQWLAFMVEAAGLPSIISQEIALVSVETAESRPLTDNNAQDLVPAWSPDGQRLTFVSSRDGNEEIYVMNADGTNPINLTADPAMDYAPAWSTSGNYIAFMSSRGIFTMNSDGTNQSKVNGDYFSTITRPSWLPIPKP